MTPTLQLMPITKLAERLWKKDLQLKGIDTRLTWETLTEDHRFRWVEMAIEAELEIERRPTVEKTA